MVQLSPAATILLLNVLCVVLIVRDRRFDWEIGLHERFGIDRHWWIPPLALLAAISFSVVSFSSVVTAFTEKFDIIMLIFSFGLMAEGLRSSNFFRYLAHRAVKKGGGDTSRLILYMFLLTSALTFFTSNDIVVYLMTPVVVSICAQSGIRNTKLILLSQFVAANTLSTGMLIGSPTNIIIAESIGLDFFTYLVLMTPPAAAALLSSFLLLKGIIKVVDSDRIPVLDDMRFDGEYEPEEIDHVSEFTSEMRDWLAIFGFFVVLIAAVTFLGLSLLWCAVPAILISLGYWHLDGKHTESIRKPLGNLPYGIFFFGMTFFIFAEQFSRTGFVNTELVPFLQSFFQRGTLETALTGVFGSGIMVNMFLDLPSAAIIGQILPELELASATDIVLTQSVLVGLNIGTYVTSIGALAGLIWFKEIGLQREHEGIKDGEMIFPSRIDLVRYGTLSFLVTGVSVAVFLAVESALLGVAGI